MIFLRVCSILMLCLFGHLSNLVAQSLDWQRYEDSTLACSVLFPKGEILIQSDTAITEIGQLVLDKRVFSSVTTEDISFFSLSRILYPPESVHEDSSALLKDFFTITAKTAAETVGGTILYQSEKRYRNHPGWTWKIEYNKGESIIQTRAIVIDHSYYALTAAALRPYSLSPAIETFFSSFRFLKAPFD